MILRTVVPSARRPAILAVACLSSLSFVQPAVGDELHTVRPGETLWSIAAARNYTTRAVAAANGISPDAAVYAGDTIRIPSASAAAMTPPAMGAYTVRPGDTLTGIAVASGLQVDQLAWMNGLSPEDPLLAGTALKLPPGAAPASAPSPEPTRVPEAPPHPTDERVDPGFVQGTALEHGVSPALAAAIAEQESGFNNAVVSPSNARGVMQLLPGTWQFIQSSLVASPLQPASAQDNVHAGVIYLAQLLRDTGGDERMATAAYYQGLASIRGQGVLPETEAYVNDVMALKQRYGG